MRTVSAREANQQFSKLLAEAEAGGEIVITRRGTPVARLVPEIRGRTSKKRRAEIRKFLDEIRRPLGGDRFNRDELYDRG